MLLGIPIAEIWLPGSWKDFIGKIEVAGDAWLNVLGHDIVMAGKSAEELKKDKRSKSGNRVGDGRQPQELVECSMDLTSHQLAQVKQALNWGPRRAWHQYLGLGIGEDTRNAFGAAARILEIAALALTRRIPIRWFEFNPDGSGDKASATSPFPLVPINSRLVPPVYDRQNPESIFSLLSVSQSNRQSLVFLADLDRLAVLFTADSALEFLPRRCKVFSSFRDVIVTAPHHGSKHNSTAYQAVQTLALSKVAYVRSDGHYKARPCQAYRQLTDRYCTVCHGSHTPPMAVSAFGANHVWTFSSQACRC